MTMHSGARSFLLRMLAVSGCAFVAGLGASAQSPAALQKGQAIATQKCANCHAIARTDKRPHAIVLPFRDFHTRYPIDMLTDALKTGVIEGHDEMPMFELKGDDMVALLSYIDALAPPGSPRYVHP